MCERTHWLVEASVLIGLHPSFDPSIFPEELAMIHGVWTQYRLERKRRGDVLRALIATAADGLYSAPSQFPPNRVRLARTAQGSSYSKILTIAG
ncbi:Methionine aminopeptidase, type I [Phytophthora palmivora]|uniref:Methionine aminopeptidase, type I n=1 Tax=Phytophthora palmivora TaxID=4796 RepID=A0A2P4XMU2_9STRA|nr:Methionine aminopeptidase, type I [Phytophthora palmivora]